MAELTKERFKKVASDRFDKDVISRPTISYWGDAWRRLKKNPVAMFSLGLLIFCIIMTIIGPYIRGLDFYFSKWRKEKSRTVFRILVRIRQSGT